MWLLAVAAAVWLTACTASATAAQNSAWTKTPSSRMQHKQRALVIDCDGTLYGPDAGIEQQIVDNIHRFGKDVMGTSAADCDDLHAR
jgi:hypothetical protein